MRAGGTCAEGEHEGRTQGTLEDWLFATGKKAEQTFTARTARAPQPRLAHAAARTLATPRLPLYRPAHTTSPGLPLHKMATLLGLCCILSSTFSATANLPLTPDMVRRAGFEREERFATRAEAERFSYHGLYGSIRSAHCTPHARARAPPLWQNLFAGVRGAFPKHRRQHLGDEVKLFINQAAFARATRQPVSSLSTKRVASQCFSPRAAASDMQQSVHRRGDGERSAWWRQFVERTAAMGGGQRQAEQLKRA